ncbi:MAG: hypothetical protein WC958_06045 [Dehalococcoidales bacterium]
MKYLTTLFLIPFILTGCILKYEDVSNEPEYKQLLNTRYSLKTRMVISGINLPPGYGKDINIYVVYPLVSGRITGPKIISEEILHSSTIIEVLGVRKSVNHIPGYQSIDAIITVYPYEKATNVPVVIDLRYLQSTNYVQKLK